MKNKTIAKAMATMMALALAFTVMPSMGVHAMEIDENGYEIHVNDGLAHSDKQIDNSTAADYKTDDMFVGEQSGGSDGDSSYNEPSYDYSSSNDGGGSSSSESYDSYDGGNGSYDAGSSISTANGGAATVAPAANTGTGKSNVVSVPGYEKWRRSSKATAGQFTVMHCGIVRYQFQLIDAEGNAVSYKGADLAKDEAGLWYINITTDDTVDTTGWGVDTLKGSITYMPELGVTGVMLNGTVIASGT